MLPDSMRDSHVFADASSRCRVLVGNDEGGSSGSEEKTTGRSSGADMLISLVFGGAASERAWRE